jgi:DNA repair exonuclease SbcCD ATPase subunit
MGKYSDVTITCSQCGKDFMFSEDEQEFYRIKGFTTPHRCKPCRSNSRQHNTLTCSHCGNKLSPSDSLTCIACLTAVQLSSDLKVKEIQNILEQTNAKLAVLESEKSTLLSDANERVSLAQAESKRLSEEASSRMAASESEKNEIQELLRRREQTIVELEWRLNETNLELEKAGKYRTTLEGLEPSLVGLNEKLVSLERNQNNLIQALLQLADKLEERHRNPVLDMLRDFVRLDSSRTARE